MAVQISGNDITVPRDTTVTRNLTVGGVLTYEDVTNVDSVGLVTARTGIEIGARPGVAASISVDGNAIFSGITTVGGNIKVGSGITLSPDGDVFTTGVSTVKGIQINGTLEGQDLKVGTGVTITRDGDIFATGISTFSEGFAGDVIIDDKIVHRGDTDTAIRFAGVNTITAETAGSERVRITSDGRLLINSTAARNVGGGVSRLIEVESSGGGAGISIVRNQNTASPGTLDLGKSRGYPHTIVQDDDKLGIVNFCGADGTDLQSSAAQIVGEVDGTPGENDMPGRLTFKTTADGSNSPTERLRITASGQLEFRNIDTAAETGAATQVNWIGPYVYQHSKTVTATTNGSGAVTFDLGCPFYYDGTTFEYFINASPTDNTNFTTTYQKGFFTKARGGGLGQFEVIKNDSAKAGCSLGTPTAGNPNGHQFNIAISGAVANKEYRATILYTGISRYAGYT